MQIDVCVDAPKRIDDAMHTQTRNMCGLLEDQWGARSVSPGHHNIALCENKRGRSSSSLCGCGAEWKKKRQNKMKRRAQSVPPINLINQVISIRIDIGINTCVCFCFLCELCTWMEICIIYIYKSSLECAVWSHDCDLFNILNLNLNDIHILLVSQNAVFCVVSSDLHEYILIICVGNGWFLINLLMHINTLFI